MIRLLKPLLLTAALCCSPLQALAAALSPSDVVLNAYLSLRSELGREQPMAIEGAVARSQSRFWEYQLTAEAAFEQEWNTVEKSAQKWALISAVGKYLQNALSRLMGSRHAVAGVNVRSETVSSDTAYVTADVQLISLDAPTTVYFLLRNTRQGWKIFDFKAPQGGFHLVHNIRSNSLPTLQDQGVEATIKHLQSLAEQ